MSEKISFNPFEPFFLTFVSFTIFVTLRKFYIKNKASFHFLITFYNSYDTFFKNYDRAYYGIYHYYPGLIDDESDDELVNLEEKVKKIDEIKTNTTKLRYEDKYKEYIQNNSKDYIFTEEEEREMENSFKNQYKSIVSNYETQITNLHDKLKNIKQKNTVLEKMSETEFMESFKENCYDYDYDYDYDSIINLDKDDIIKNNYELWKNLETEISKFEKKMEDIETIKTEALEYSKNKLIEEKINKLNGCFVMETTPLGNVLMTYNIKRTSFTYYSDNTIPYRYLEVVARKFVKTFDCRPIFVDMEEELKNYEKKIKDHQKQQEEKQEEERQQNEKGEQKKPSKNVFAKLKNYNKPSSKISNAPPPKSSLPSQNMSKDSSNMLLKENANRYTYEGKITTFNVLKKVERKVVDKKYGMTFANFKNLQKKGLT